MLNFIFERHWKSKWQSQGTDRKHNGRTVPFEHTRRLDPRPKKKSCLKKYNLIRILTRNSAFERGIPHCLGPNPWSAHRAKICCWLSWESVSALLFGKITEAVSTRHFINVCVQYEIEHKNQKKRCENSRQRNSTSVWRNPSLLFNVTPKIHCPLRLIWQTTITLHACQSFHSKPEGKGSRTSWNNSSKMFLLLLWKVWVQRKLHGTLSLHVQLSQWTHNDSVGWRGQI